MNCRGCGVALPVDLALIGICAWCVADSLRPALSIPRPRYGDDGEADEDSAGGDELGPEEDPGG